MEYLDLHKEIQLLGDETGGKSISWSEGSDNNLPRETQPRHQQPREVETTLLTGHCQPMQEPLAEPGPNI